MGGSRHLGADGPGGLDDGRGQSGPLHRVGARPQLIEEDKGILVRFGQDAHDIGHVGGEGGQGLGDGLLIADVGQHPGKNPDGGVVSGRDMEAALGHEGDKAHGFQRNRLAAGVGAGDDKGVEALPQLQIVGDSLLLVQQGVPRSPQV